MVSMQVKLGERNSHLLHNDVYQCEIMFVL